MLYLKPTKMKTKSQTWSSWVLCHIMNKIYLQMLSPIWYCTYWLWSFCNDDDSHLLHCSCMRTQQSSHCGTWSSLTATYASSPICVYSRNTCKWSWGQERVFLSLFLPLTCIAYIVSLRDWGTQSEDLYLHLSYILLCTVCMKCHHAHIIYHILHSVLVAGDISRMSTSPPSEPKHTKGPLCFQVLIWKAGGT